MEGVGHIVFIILGRVLNRLTDLNERCKVHHRIKTTVLQHLNQQGFVRQVTLNKIAIQDRIPVAIAEVVQRGDMTS